MVCDEGMGVIGGWVSNIVFSSFFSGMVNVWGDI